VRKKRGNLKERLRDVLSPVEIEELKRAYDILGEIAIVEIPDSLKSREGLIGREILTFNKNIKAVYKKVGRRKEVFREMDLKLLAGRDRETTTYREHGCVFKFHFKKVFFSPRLSTERKRIADQVKDNELIGAFFAGVGPFPIVIAKRKYVMIYAIELNPVAFRDLKKNIKLNKLENKIYAVFGDVKKLAPEIAALEGKFDRILMPIPKTSEDFLETCMSVIKKGGIIHFYYFGERETPFREAEKRIKKTAEKLKKKYNIVFKRKVRPFSAKIVQVVVDFRVF